MSNIITEVDLKIRCLVCNATVDMYVYNSFPDGEMIDRLKEFKELHYKCSKSLLNAETQTTVKKPDA